MIVARNDLGENRTSGRDSFEVIITQQVPVPDDNEDPDAKPTEKSIPCEINDTDDGFYHCKYTADDECNVSIDIKFLNDKE